MSALRDDAANTSSESSALFVTPASSSAGNVGTDPQQLRTGAVDTDDELYRCTPDPAPRQARRADAAVFRESYLTAQRERRTSRAPSPGPRQEQPSRRTGPFHEDTPSVPSEERSSNSPLGVVQRNEESDEQAASISHNERRNSFHESKDHDAAANCHTEQNHPQRQGSRRGASEPLSHSSFPDFVQEGDDAADVDDTEMVDAPASQGQERRASREIPSSSPLSSRSVTPEIPERDWEIVRIVQTRVKNGIRERNIAWTATRHSEAVIQSRPGGEVVLNVAGVRWGGMREQTVGPSEFEDDGTVKVYWATTWHPDWDLPMDLVARWEGKYGVEETEKEEKTQPRWWLWPEQTEECLPPEPEPDPGERDLMPSTEEATFSLESGKDYTISFLEDRRAGLMLQDSNDGLQEPFILKFLNSKVRNRLRVIDSCEKYEFRPSTSFFRTALIYIFGTAMLKPCSHCRDGNGPYSRCIIWLGELNGACCNCSYLRRGTSCEYHLSVRWMKVPTLTTDEDAMEVDDDPPPDNSSISDSTNAPPSSDPDNSRPDDFRDSSNENTSSTDTPGIGDRDDDVPVAEEQDRVGSYSSDEGRHDRQTHCHTNPGTIDDDVRSQQRHRRRTRSDSDTSIKSEEVDASSQGKRTFHHRGCPPPPVPCCDPVCGRVLEAANNQANRVFHGDSFTKGQATDEHVKFILSCCPCTNTQALQQAWDEFRRVEQERKIPQRYGSRERYFSHDCWRVLNQLITWCPERWKFNGEIDLTDD